MSRIAVVGSGVVGTATGKGFLSKGHEVTFIDISSSRVEALREMGLEALLPNELEWLTPDFIIVTVSTPPHARTGAVVLDYIKNSMETVGILVGQAHQSAVFPVVVIRSTVPPGTTLNVLLPLLEEHSDLQVGQHFGLCMQPEFLRAKSSEEDFLHPWVTVIGEYDGPSGKALHELYTGFTGTFYRFSIPEAEALKYAHNLRNATIISFNNEMWWALRQMGIEDPNKLLSAVTHTAESAWNPQYGSIGGRPYGGTCLPKDTQGLHAHAVSRGIQMPLLRAVIDVNHMFDLFAHEGQVEQAVIEGLAWKANPILAALQAGQISAAAD